MSRGWIREQLGLALPGWRRFWELLGAVWADRTLRLSIAVLLVVDLGWTLWYGFARYLDDTGIDTSYYALRRLRITTDGGWPELYSYGKTVLLVVVLARLATALRQPIYAALTLLFAVILLDDAVGIHESWGLYFAETFEFAPWRGIRPRDVGELMTWAILGLCLLVPLGVGFVRSERAHRVSSLALVPPFGLLIVSATVVDQLYHVYRYHCFSCGIVMTMMEDGGEMIAVTIVLALAAALLKLESVPMGGAANARAVLDGAGESALAPASGLSRRQLLRGAVATAVIGLVVMSYLNAFELTSDSRYHPALTAAAHWIGYHNPAFEGGDLLVEYASVQSSPVHDALYWLGAPLFGVVPLSRLIGMGLFALTAAGFFVAVAATAGARAGILAALFYMVLPAAGFATAGGLASGWAMGILLLGVYVIDQHRWPVLLWVLPLAALTDPAAAVSIGAAVLASMLLDVLAKGSKPVRGVKPLALGSVLAAIPLVYALVTPSAQVGKLLGRREVLTNIERGLVDADWQPLWRALLRTVEHPFFVYAGLVLLALLSRRGFEWKRSWTAVLLGSIACHGVAGEVLPYLGLPDRYTRYSVAVVMVLWLAHNCSRALALLEYAWLRRCAVAALGFVTALSFAATFRPSDGEDGLARWEDKDRFAPLAAAIAAQPLPVRVAGHPYTLGHVMVQSKRPVLIVDQMAEPWYDGFRGEYEARARDTFRAIYARDLAEVDLLATEYRATHMVVRKLDYEPRHVRSGKLWRPHYDHAIARLARQPGRAVLHPPPPSAVLYEDDWFWLIRLPVANPISSH